MDIMKFITASWPNAPRTEDAKRAAYGYAFALIIITVAQLFDFEKFAPLLGDFGLPGEQTVGIVATILVVCGVMALPFLLRMKLSAAMRWASMIAGWLVVLIWLLLTLWVNVSGMIVDNIGLLGARVQLIPGWWAVFFIIGLGTLAAWASWGLWPRRRRSSLESHRRK